MRKIISILNLLLIIALVGCSSHSKYPDEIKLAYDYLDPGSQKTIKNWKRAQVREFKPIEDLEILNEEKDQLVNIKGIETLTITFQTDEDEILGPIVVYIDKNSKEVMGIGARK